VLNYLPVLVERFARQRLRALAKVEGKHDSGVPVVLFLCTHNAGRAQMALGFFQHCRGPRRRLVRRLRPRHADQPAALAAMRERGIDISGEYPKPWTDKVVRAADVVVTMGCGDACPVFPGRRYEDWVLDDPAGLDLDDVRPIRDEIERRVADCLRNWRFPPVPDAPTSPPSEPVDAWLGRRLLAEFVGTGVLVAVVIGSGIAAQQLTPATPACSYYRTPSPPCSGSRC
jgi:arsenate reductase